MQSQSEINVINKQLLDTFGKPVALDKPHFRIVWSTDQLEKCYRENAVFTESGIFLRNEKGVSEGPKYPMFENKWVLERLYQTAGNPYLEEVVPYSYEPVWVFGSANSNPDPNWKAVLFMLNGMLFSKKKFLTAADVKLLEIEQIAQEKAKFKEMLKDDSPYIAGMLKSGSAVLNAGTTPNEDEHVK